MYVIGLVSYIAMIAAKLIIRPELLSIPVTLALIAGGIVIGALYMKYLQKKVTGRRPYLALKQGMIVVWVVSSIGILLTQTPHWTYWLCILLVAMSVGYFYFYIPKFIEIKNYLAELNRQ